MSARSALTVIAAGILAASCTSPTSGGENPTRDPSWMDAGTPATSTAAERETRYYKDENGILWDDRGKKRDNML